MKPTPSFILALVSAVCLSSCSAPQLQRANIPHSEPAAVRLVMASQRAHGATAFQKIRSVQVRYDGQWGPVGPKFQPVMVDEDFRKTSEERFLPASRAITQRHVGPKGVKVVSRTPGKVSVSYNGVPNQDEEKRAAAALVADAYQMFLLGPFYFKRPGATFALAGGDTVDGRPCDSVLAVLRPGFGFTDEDRVLLSIDRESKMLRRVRMTLNGLETTQGAEVDVTFRDFRRIDGVMWPADFDERIRVPFDLHVHHWRLVDLKTNAPREQ